MSNPEGTIFSRTANRIGRTVLVALLGQVFFLVSVITMIPLRMAKEPVVNYNLFYMPILALFFFALFYRACVEQDEARGILYGYFSALVSWPLIGEVASMPLDEGMVKQFSSMNIKLLGGYFYVAIGWILLKVMWRTKAVKTSVRTFFLVFLSIWSFELYMDNYSSKVPLEMMPVIAIWVAVVFGIASLLILFLAWRATTTARKNLLGCILYITLSLVIMGSSQWKTPSKFYVKYEGAHLDHEIEELQKEKEHLNFLREYMLKEGLATEEDFAARKPTENAPATSPEAARAPEPESAQATGTESAQE
jgi:hypothetical protein